MRQGRANCFDEAAAWRVKESAFFSMTAGGKRAVEGEQNDEMITGC